MKRQGFTFLEVVLALAIIGVISAFLLRIVSGSLGITDHISVMKESELGTAGRLESSILGGVTGDRELVTVDFDSIHLLGTDEVMLTCVEEVDEETGQIFRYYIPELEE